MTDGQNIRPLTALRFIAAMWVVMFHFWPNLTAATPGLVAKGYLGVELFFILSGFILCHVYRQGLAERRFRYGAFLWARLARVYPLHLATLAGLGTVAAIATWRGFRVDPNILSWASLPANLTLTQAWGFAPVAGWNHPSWSISAEWFAYLTFPLSAGLALKLKDRPRLGVALALGLILVLYPTFQALAGFPLTLATIRFGFLRIVPCFLYGCALHGLWRAKQAEPAGGESGAFALGGALISGAGVVTMASLGAPDGAIVAALGGLIFFLARVADSGSELLTAPPLVYLGEISYSVYMVCIPWKIVYVNGVNRILQLNDPHLPFALWLGLVFGVIPLAAFSYHLVEKPARSALKLMADSGATRRPSAASA